MMRHPGSRFAERCSSIVSESKNPCSNAQSFREIFQPAVFSLLPGPSVLRVATKPMDSNNANQASQCQFVLEPYITDDMLGAYSSPISAGSSSLLGFTGIKPVVLWDSVVVAGALCDLALTTLGHLGFPILSLLPLPESLVNVCARDGDSLSEG